MSSVFFFGFSILVGFLTIFIGKTSPVEAFLSAFLFAQVGLMGVYDFTRHFYRADEMAGAAGRQKDSPYQKEMAFTHLAVGALGLLSPVLRGNFWTAGVLAYTIFMAGGVIVRLRRRHAGTEEKMGVEVWLCSVAAPLLMLILLAAYASPAG